MNTKQRKTVFYKTGLVFVHGRISKDIDPGTLPNLKWSSLQQLVTTESWKVS